MVTDEQITAARQQILADAAAGVSRVVVDGEVVELADAVDRLKALDLLQTSAATPRSHFGMRTTRLISPGGWS